MAPLVRALSGGLGLLQPAKGQRERRRVVLRDVHCEGLAEMLGHRVNRSELAGRGIEVADRDQSRYAPLHRLGLQLALPEALREVARLAQYAERQREAAG